MRERILNQLRDFVSVPSSQIKDEAFLGADLGLDSLNFVELTVRLEEEFGLPDGFTDSLGDRDITVAHLISVIGNYT